MAMSIKSLAIWQKQSVMSVCHSLKLIIPVSVIISCINYSDHAAKIVARCECVCQHNV